MSPKAAPRKAYSYVRFSSPEQAKGDSFRRQTEAAQAFAARHGYALDEELTLHDLGTSAFRGRNASHGALAKFLRAVEDDVVPAGSCLILESMDRFSREGAWDALPTLQSIINAGVSLGFPARDKVVDRAELRSSPFVLMEILLELIRAHEESATKAKRLKAAWVAKRERAEKREVQTRRVPAWIAADEKRRLQLIPERAKIIRRIFDDYTRGIGATGIARQLNIEEVPTWGDSGHRPARQWHKSYVSKILCNSATHGVFVPHIEEHDANGRMRRIPQEPVPAYYPAAISNETFERAQLLLASARARTGEKRGPVAGHGVVALTAGLARCPICGGSMTRVVKGRKGGPPKLVCALAKGRGKCTYRLVKLPDVEAALVRNAKGLSEPPLLDDDLAEQLKGANDELFRLNEQIEALVNAIEQRPSAALSKRLAEREAEAEKVRAELRELQARRAETESTVVRARARRLFAQLVLYAADAGAHVQVANAALRECLSEIVVRYDSGDLELRWRHGPVTTLLYDAQFEVLDSPRKRRAVPV